MTGQAVALLAILFLTHFLGDFTPLASARIQDAKVRGKPLGPIALHAAIHATLVGVAVAAVARPVPLLVAAAVAVEFWTHLVLDWFRGWLGASRSALSDPSGQAFWTALGIDQLAHALVLVWIADLVLR